MQTGNRSRSVCVGSQEENNTQWVYKARHPKIVCRFASPLGYANAEVLTNAVLELIGSSPSRPQWCALTFDHIQEVDYVAAKNAHEVGRQPGDQAREAGTCTHICRGRSVPFEYGGSFQHQNQTTCPRTRRLRRFAMFV